MTRNPETMLKAARERIRELEEPRFSPITDRFS